MYNKVKPVSSESQIFKQIQELPIIDFPVEQHGSMFQSNLNVNVKKNAIFESATGKNIARMMIKVNAQSLGNITVNFKDVLLENGAYCLVYTQDHQIVAGPIYQKSISNNQFTIMNIPASELILEVIYKDKNDFTMKLNEVSFESLVNLNEVKKKKQQEQFLGGLYGLNFLDNVVFDSYKSCTSGKYYPFGCLYTGHPSINDHKSLQKLYSANDSIFVDFNSTRSRAVLMVKQFNCDANDTTNESFRFRTTNATLINFPYINCDSSFITVSKHEYPYNDVRNNINNIADNSIVRFNLHYKYGTPYHLWNVNCESSISNFNKWRETIDFNEVVDYQGVEVVAYKSDFDILLIKEKLIFKENHIGWTTQDKYDIFQENTQDGLNFYYPDEVQENIYILASRGGYSPTSYFDKFKVLPGNQVVSLESNYPDGFSGYSGSVIFKNKLYGFDDQFFYSQIYNVSTYENDYEMFLGNHIYTIIKSKMDFCNFCDTTNILRNYWSNNNLFFYTDTISYNFYNYHDSTLIGSSNELINFLPSMNNKEKCPSPVEPQNPCDFDINDYITYSVTNGEVCITINEIPDDKFPDPDNLPKGYRIYHNFGEQKTEAWQSFQGGNDISFPIQFCIDKCYMMWLMSLGKENINIAIDFYDGDGNAYNNDGCDDISINIEFPKMCNLFDINVNTLSSDSECCEYEIELNIADCEVANPALSTIYKMLLDSIQFETTLETNPIPLKNMDNLDTANGKITFTYLACPEDRETLTNFKLKVPDSGPLACITDTIDFPACLCDCPDDIDSWVEFSVGKAEWPCPTDKCLFKANLNIPELNSMHSCYNYFSAEPNGGSSMPITNPTQFVFSECLDEGESKNRKVYLKKSPSDTIPCIVEYDAYCNKADFLDACVPDCDSVNFEVPAKELDFQVPGCSGCFVFTRYTHRETTCIPTKQDIQILSMETYGDCDTCNVSADELYKESLLKIIHNNAMGFKPEDFNDPCDNTWRVVTSSCWANYTYYCYSHNPEIGYYPCLEVFEPCDSVSCCTINLMVCRDFDGSISVQTIGQDLQSDSCSNYSQFVDNGQSSSYEVICEGACDWLLDLNEHYFGREVLINNDDNNHNMKENNEFKLKLNLTYQNNQVKLLIDSQVESNNLNIAISSLEGKQLKSLKADLNLGFNEYVIDYNEISSGLYLVSISLDGYLLKTEKIVKVK